MKSGCCLSARAEPPAPLFSHFRPHHRIVFLKFALGYCLPNFLQKVLIVNKAAPVMSWKVKKKKDLKKFIDALERLEELL